MPFTPDWAIPYQTLDNAPDGSDLGEKGFLAVDGHLTTLNNSIADNATAIADGVVLLDAVQTNFAATDVTSGTTEKSLTRLASTSMPLNTSRLYRTDFQIVTTRTVITDEFEFRLRQKTALSGTVVGSTIGWGVSTTAGKWVRGSILWVPATTETTTVHLSVVRNAGTGTMTVFYQNFAQKTRTHVVHRQIGLASAFREITT